MELSIMTLSEKSYREGDFKIKYNENKTNYYYLHNFFTIKI